MGIILLIGKVFKSEIREQLYYLSLSYQNDISSFFYEENQKFIDSISILSMKLRFDESKFEEALSFLEKRDYESYQKHNQWVEGVLYFEDRELDVEVKIHGKTPNFHQVNEYTSLSVKGKESVLGREKFRFIIYERVRENPDKIKRLAKEFDLYYQKGELVSLEVNEKSPHLFYWEDPLKKEFLRESGLINPSIKGHKSPIVGYGEKVGSILPQLQEKLNSQIKGTEKRNAIFNRYVQLNNAIANKEVNGFHNFFDTKYIASFQAARTIAGFVNHGFTKENLYFALDTSNYLFYPVLHRDNYFGAFDSLKQNSYKPFYYEGIEELHFVVLELCSKNEQIKNRANELLQEFITKENKFLNDMDSIKTFHNKLAVTKWSFIDNKVK